MMLPMFEWLNDLGVSRAINESSVISALLNSFHLLALVLFAGAILVVDLRLLGRGLTPYPVAQLARQARPFVTWGFVGLVVTGVPQLMSLAEKEYYSEYFWMKMYFLAAALIFTLTIRRKITQAGSPGAEGVRAKIVGLASIALWSGVAVSARLIGLF